MKVEDIEARLTTLKEMAAYARTLTDILTAQNEALAEENKRLKAKLAEMGVPDDAVLN